MKRTLLIFCLLFLGFYEVNAQTPIGCAVGNRIYTKKQGNGVNYKNSPSNTYGPECNFTTAGTCVVKGSPDQPGVLVYAVECPIDESYAFLGMGLIISIIAFKKINPFVTV